MKTSHYADRQRCEAAGLEYDSSAIGDTVLGISIAAEHKRADVLDLFAPKLNLQVAAFLESQYERAGVISGGGES